MLFIYLHPTGDCLPFRRLSATPSSPQPWWRVGPIRESISGYSPPVNAPGGEVLRCIRFVSYPESLTPSNHPPHLRLFRTLAFSTTSFLAPSALFIISSKTLSSHIIHQMRLAVLLFSLSFFLTAHAKIIQIQIVHRHGARHILDKHETDPRREQENPNLYQQGVEQLERLGSYCRDHYVERNKPSSIDAVSPNSVLDTDVISWTSNFRRTQLSARAFLSQLYPDNHERISTLVFNGTETDWIIRGYALCPTLAQRFQAFVNEDSEYNDQKNQHEAFVANLAKKLGYSDQDATFENVFNVYDQYNIIQNNYDEAQSKDTEKLSDTDMDKLKDIADWYESHKFSFATHNIHVAGGLLATIMDHVPDESQGTRWYRIVHFSAHYPTLLTLLASIRARSEDELKWPADQIPEFGAALIFEIHEEDDGERYLHMKWYPGGEGDPEPKPMAIGRDGCTDAEKGCKLSTVERAFAFDTFREESFCRDCGSASGVCASSRQSGGEQVAGESVTVTEDVCSIGAKATSGAIGGAVGLVIGLAIWLSYSMVTMKRKRTGMDRAAGNGLDTRGFEGEVYA